MRVYPAGPIPSNGGTLWICDGAPRGAALEWTLTGPGTLVPNGTHADAGGVGSAAYIAGGAAEGSAVSVSVRAYPVALDGPVTDGQTPPSGGVGPEWPTTVSPTVRVTGAWIVQILDATYDPVTGVLQLDPMEWYIRNDGTFAVRVWDYYGVPHTGIATWDQDGAIQLDTGLLFQFVGGKIRVDINILDPAGYNTYINNLTEVLVCIDGTALNTVTNFTLWDINYYPAIFHSEVYRGGPYPQSAEHAYVIIPVYTDALDIWIDLRLIAPDGGYSSYSDPDWMAFGWWYATWNTFTGTLYGSQQRVTLSDSWAYSLANSPYRIAESATPGLGVALGHSYRHPALTETGTPRDALAYILETRHVIEVAYPVDALWHELKRLSVAEVVHTFEYCTDEYVPFGGWVFQTLEPASPGYDVYASLNYEVLETIVAAMELAEVLRRPDILESTWPVDFIAGDIWSDTGYVDAVLAYAIPDAPVSAGTRVPTLISEGATPGDSLRLRSDTEMEETASAEDSVAGRRVMGATLRELATAQDSFPPYAITGFGWFDRLTVTDLVEEYAITTDIFEEVTAEENSTAALVIGIKDLFELRWTATARDGYISSLRKENTVSADQYTATPADNVDEFVRGQELIEAVEPAVEMWAGRILGRTVTAAQMSVTAGMPNPDRGLGRNSTMNAEGAAPGDGVDALLNEEIAEAAAAAMDLDRAVARAVTVTAAQNTATAGDKLYSILLTGELRQELLEETPLADELERGLWRAGTVTTAQNTATPADNWFSRLLIDILEIASPVDELVEILYKPCRVSEPAEPVFEIDRLLIRAGTVTVAQMTATPGDTIATTQINVASVSEIAGASYSTEAQNTSGELPIEETEGYDEYNCVVFNDPYQLLEIAVPMGNDNLHGRTDLHDFLRSGGVLEIANPGDDMFTLFGLEPRFGGPATYMPINIFPAGMKWSDWSLPPDHPQALIEENWRPGAYVDIYTWQLWESPNPPDYFATVQVGDIFVQQLDVFGPAISAVRITEVSSQYLIKGVVIVTVPLYQRGYEWNNSFTIYKDES